MEAIVSELAWHRIEMYHLVIAKPHDIDDFFKGIMRKAAEDFIGIVDDFLESFISGVFPVHQIL